MITSKQYQLLNEYIEKLKNPDDFLKQIELQLESARWFQNIGFDQLKQIRNGRCPTCIGSKIKKINDIYPFDGIHNIFIDCPECESDFDLEELEALERKIKPF